MTVQVWYSKIQFYGLTDKQTLSFVLQLKLYILSKSQDLVVRLVSFLFSLSFYFLF